MWRFDVNIGYLRYAKVRMVSVYKDAFSVDKWSRNAPHMYLTFEYVMVPKGSKKFEIKP